MRYRYHICGTELHNDVESGHALHNERPTLKAILSELDQVDMPIPWELLIIDGSTDGGVLDIDRDSLHGPERVRVIRNERNQGKGAALRVGFAHAEGDILAFRTPTSNTTHARSRRSSTRS
jgi:cellulose synthase/poly-beta-1,6-N-acetylglucosamine synthase-like glycosyltransferase